MSSECDNEGALSCLRYDMGQRVKRSRSGGGKKNKRYTYQWVPSDVRMRQRYRYGWPNATNHPKMLVVSVYGEIWEFTYFFASSDIWTQQRSRCGWPDASTKSLVVNVSGKLAVWFITFHLVTGDQQWRRAFRRWTFALYWPQYARYKTNLESDHLEKSLKILFSLYLKL